MLARVRHPLVAVAAALVLTIPSISTFVSYGGDGTVHPGDNITPVIAGLAILGAAFLLAWAAETAEEIVQLLATVREGDRMTLTYETPDGEERTARVEAAMRAQATEPARDKHAEGTSRSGIATSTATPSRLRQFATVRADRVRLWSTSTTIRRVQS